MPSELLRVCTPLPVDEVVTLNELIPEVMVIVAGTAIVAACPPSPVTKNVAAVGAGALSATVPAPVTDRAPADEMLTVPDPDPGLNMVPN